MTAPPMRIGIGLPLTLPGADRHNLLEWARRAEQRGFDTLGPSTGPSTTALNHSPRCAQRPPSPTGSGSWPASCSGRCDPTHVMLAKQVATLDVISGGRLVLGLAPRVREDDFTAGGVDYHNRGAALDALTATLRACWQDGSLIGPRPPVAAGHRSSSAVPPPPPSAESPPTAPAGSPASALPHAKPVLVGAVSSEQVALLVRGELDLAMVRTPIERPGDVRLLTIYREDVGVLMSPVSPLAAKPALHCGDLAGRELILFPRERAPGAYDDLLSKLRKAGGTVTVSKSAIPMSQLRAMLPLRPAAIALVPCRAAAPPDVVWRPLEGNPLTATIAVAWQASTRNTQVRALLASLRRTVASGPLSAS